MTFIKEILEKHPDAGYWHQQYPWFATGQLIDAFNKKNTPAFEATAQKATVFFNSIPRLHWLLHQSENVAVQISETAKDDTTTIPDSTNTEESSLPVLAAQALAEPKFTIDLSAEADIDEEEPEVEENDEDLITVNHLSSSLAEVASSFKTAPTEDELAYQAAYQHTIDYFASQGIKLDGEPAKDDRFGQQLKTFTSWLRQMKPLVNTDGDETDPVVVENAAYSLQKGDILTEPMADILLKQGKKTQALHLLEKLRLLYPEKSLYFAARIDQIKNLK